MTPARLPPNEAERLRCLGDLDLGGISDPVLDGLVRCASHLLDYPVALVSLVEEHRQWFPERR